MRMNHVNEQAILLGLCRVDPALDYDYQRRRPGAELASHLSQQFRVEEGHLLLADSLGRWDLFLAARLPELGFSPASRLPHVEGLKKLDLQYGYGDPGALDGFQDGRAEQPFMLVTYLHIRDDLSLRAPRSSHRAVGDRLAETCRAVSEEISAVTVRLVGWPDYAVIAAGQDLEALINWAQNKVWSLPVKLDFSDEQERAEEQRLATNTTHWPTWRNTGSEPIFSRTFSTLCVVDPLGSDSVMEGKLHSVQVDLRIRSGADVEVMRRIADKAQALRLKYDPWLQPGCTDISVHLRLPRDGVESSRFIPWYFRDLMPELKDLITTSELRIGAPLPAETPREYLGRKPVLPVIKLPQTFIDRAEDSSAGKAVAACVRAMHRTLSSVSVNDGMYGSCADLHLYGLGFCKYLEESMKQGSELDLARLLQEAGEVSAHFSTAMGQRLYGSYYDLTADKPEGLIEHVGGRQKHMLALWGLQEALLEGLRETISLTDPAFGYWAVNRAGEPGECLACGRDLFVFQVCSSSAFPARQLRQLTEKQNTRHWEVPCHVVGHEIGHAALYLLGTKVQDAREEGEPVDLLPGPLPEFLVALQGIEPGTEGGSAPTPFPEEHIELLMELYADAYSFLLFLGADLSAYQRSVSDLAGRLRVSNRVGRAQLAYRAWAIHQCGSALKRIADKDDPIAAVGAYAKLPLSKQRQVLLPGLMERDIPANHLDHSEGRRKQVGTEVHAAWAAAQYEYRDPNVLKVLTDGWGAMSERELELRWDETDILRLAEMALVLGMRAATWSLGLRVPHEDDNQAGRNASEMCRLFVNYARSGGSEDIEHMWEWAMGALGDRINLAHLAQEGAGPYA